MQPNFMTVAGTKASRYDAVHGEGVEALVIAHWWASAKPRQRAWVAALLALGVCGMAFRFWLAFNSIGCDDAPIWAEHADLINGTSVKFAYQHPELESFQFNHPPLMGYLAAFARRVSGEDMVEFALWMKAPGLLAELLAAYLLFDLWLARSVPTAALAFAGYATSLTQIQVSGFHGNTDCAYAGLSLLAFYLMDKKRSPLLSGLALAAALNVKILPLLMVPPLLAQCRSKRQFWRFVLGLAPSIVPLLPFLLTIPRAVYRNMFAYNSQQLEWGLFTFLKYADEYPPLSGKLETIQNAFVNGGRYLILGSIALFSLLAFFKSRRFAYHVGAASWALFLVLTPGYGVQYAVSVVPLLFAADLWSAALYSSFAGAMLFFVYTAQLHFVLPLRADVQYYPFPSIAVLFGVLAWVVLVRYVVRVVRKLLADDFAEIGASDESALGRALRQDAHAGQVEIAGAS